MNGSIARRAAQLAVAALVTTAAAAAAQQPQVTLSPTLDVGRVAPEFTLPGATRYGLLRDPVKLSDYRGQTVVLAFFPKARTKG